MGIRQRKQSVMPVKQLRQPQMQKRPQQPQRGRGGGGGGKDRQSWEQALAKIQRDAFLAGKAAAMQKGGGKGGNGAQRKNGRQGSRVQQVQPVQQQTRRGNRGGRGRRGGQGGQVQVQQQVKAPLQKHQLEFKKYDASQLCWVGGLSKKTTWKTLQKHFADVVKPKLVDVMNKNPNKPVTAKLAFETAEDVACVIDALNGSELEGSTLEVDTWTKSDKSDRPPRKERRERKRGSKSEAKAKLSKVINTKFAKAVKEKANKAGKASSKIVDLIKKTDASCKVWIGGLSEKTTWKVLEKHFADVAKPKATEIMKRGTAVLAYENAEDATNAINALNGSTLDGKTLEVDVWVKPDRSEKGENRRERRTRKGRRGGKKSADE